MHGPARRRTFIVHVPRNYANALTPVYLMFHGYTDSADRFIVASNLAEVRQSRPQPERCDSGGLAQAERRVRARAGGRLRRAMQVSEEEGFIGIAPQGYMVRAGGLRSAGHRRVANTFPVSTSGAGRTAALHSGRGIAAGAVAAP